MHWFFVLKKNIISNVPIVSLFQIKQSTFENSSVKKHFHYLFILNLTSGRYPSKRARTKKKQNKINRLATVASLFHWRQIKRKTQGRHRCLLASKGRPLAKHFIIIQCADKWVRKAGLWIRVWGRGRRWTFMYGRVFFSCLQIHCYSMWWFVRGGGEGDHPWKIPELFVGFVIGFGVCCLNFDRLFFFLLKLY